MQQAGRLLQIWFEMLLRSKNQKSPVCLSGAAKVRIFLNMLLILERINPQGTEGIFHQHLLEKQGYFCLGL